MPKARGGSGGILPQKILRNTIFSTHEICLRKIDCEYENGKKLQVAIIKVTESKENKSIYRLDGLLMCVWLKRSKVGRGGGGGQLPPCSPAMISVMVFENWSPYQFSKFVFVVCKVSVYIKAFGTEIFV